MRMLKTATVVLAGMISSLGSAQADDWTGFYGGLSLGRATGDIDFGDDGIDIRGYSGSETSAFAGYKVQMGSIVYGAELAYSNSGLVQDGVPSQTFDSFVDLKGSVGFTVGNGLYYGILGYSKDTNHRVGALGNSTGNGVIYGIGAQFAVSDRFFVGAEMVRRDIDNDGVGAPIFYEPIDGTVQSVSVRVGMTF
jgi:outer membrane immunogenic protein